MLIVFSFTLSVHLIEKKMFLVYVEPTEPTSPAYPPLDMIPVIFFVISNS